MLTKTEHGHPKTSIRQDVHRVVQYKWHLEMPSAQSRGRKKNNSVRWKWKDNCLLCTYIRAVRANLLETWKDTWLIYTFCKTPVYLKARRDQTTPTMLEYVLGLRMSLRNVMTEMSLTITIVGGMSFLFSSSSSSGSLGLSSVVEVEPNLSNRGPLLSISSTLKLCLFPKLKSSRE